MSYDIHIWKQPENLPAPATLEEAGKTMLALEGTQAGINPKFVEFARQLVKRYPSSDMYAADDPNAKDSPWQNNPVEEAQEHENAVFVLELPRDDRVTLLLFVVDTATAQGLTVFDDQLGMAFLPSGQILPEDKSALWRDLKQEMTRVPEQVTKAEMRKLMVFEFNKVFQKQGFIAKKPPPGASHDVHFFRPIEDGYQIVRATVEGSSPDYKCIVSYVLQIQPVQAILDEAWVKKPYYWSNETVSFVLKALESKTNRMTMYLPFSSSAEIGKVVSLLETNILPALNAGRNLNGIDALINRKIENSDILKYSDNYEYGDQASRLVVGYLVKNPDFNKLVEVTKQYFKKLNHLDVVIEIEKLVEYLCKNIRPIA